MKKQINMGKVEDIFQPRFSKSLWSATLLDTTFPKQTKAPPLLLTCFFFTTNIPTKNTKKRSTILILTRSLFFARLLPFNMIFLMTSLVTSFRCRSLWSTTDLWRDHLQRDAYRLPFGAQRRLDWMISWSLCGFLGDLFGDLGLEMFGNEATSSMTRRLSQKNHLYLQETTSQEEVWWLQVAFSWTLASSSVVPGHFAQGFLSVCGLSTNGFEEIFQN